ncbi:Oxysterol-binding protein OBPa [Lithohypha guttulata]|uniref:Oxysterol-binding protein OBPa n=1 Tax=Lithohypha guttulata TaxID=1690604 RepID=A0AAN7TEP5_9EURO|nr:Oxysterol-binding protein OBPa [Lithohypha guttulata]
MYARGILFGKMKYELGDHSYVHCPENNLSADIEFKVKGWVSGGYNAIGGYIKNDKTGEQYYELSGTWTGEMYAKDLKTGKKTLLFDATHAKHTPPKARPVEEQGERESQRLWQHVCKAVHVADHTVATDEKAKIEERQRQEAAERQEQGVEWRPKLFRAVDARPGGKDEGEEDLEWVLDADIDVRAPPEQIVQQILSIAPILPGQQQQAISQKQSRAPPAPERHAPPPQAQPQPQPQSHATSLIDLDSRPYDTVRSQPAPSRAEPIAGNPMHPTSNPKQIPGTEPTAQAPFAGNPPRGGSLMDHDDGPLSSRMEGMSLHQPLAPSAQSRPIQRTDSKTSETDVFVDAQG